MGDIAYDFAHIQELSSQIQSVAQQIESLLGELSSEVHKLAAGWEGEAQETWYALQSKWDNDAGELRETLEQLSSKVRDAGDAMHQAEGAITSKFQA